MNNQLTRAINNFVAFTKQLELEFATSGCVEITRDGYEISIYKRDVPLTMFDMILISDNEIEKFVSHSFAEAAAHCYFWLFEILRSAE